MTNSRNGKDGRGMAIDDIPASVEDCISMLLDFKNYPNVVPYVKSVEIYKTDKHENVMS